jgi:hypothetical protein
LLAFVVFIEELPDGIIFLRSVWPANNPVDQLSLRKGVGLSLFKPSDQVDVIPNPPRDLPVPDLVYGDKYLLSMPLSVT